MCFSVRLLRNCLAIPSDCGTETMTGILSWEDAKRNYRILLQASIAGGNEASAACVVSKALIVEMNSMINSAWGFEMEAITVLDKKGGRAMMWRNFSLMFLALVVVVAKLAALASPVMLSHEVTLNYFVSSKSFGSRRTARGEAPKPEIATNMVSGTAMFPPMVSSGELFGRLWWWVPRISTWGSFISWCSRCTLRLRWRRSSNLQPPRRSCHKIRCWDRLRRLGTSLSILS